MVVGVVCVAATAVHLLCCLSPNKATGTQHRGPSPGIARFWHLSRPYKGRYGVRMPGIELSLGLYTKEELRYCRVSLVYPPTL